ncbi:MAG: hypothetical protein J0H12_02350 [Candidatus Paracaedimonas acanthamoebae]|uniref:Uncharacterized protein n=1 Tax=Candidatus Paracaedimonas acanthamoebae TaxID=244581 RepID=A0A8J7TV82_9PROT|nr:hypothetical protein [Candidatus Paracaedimonas acanthamoebae]
MSLFLSRNSKKLMNNNYLIILVLFFITCNSNLVFGSRHLIDFDTKNLERNKNIQQLEQDFLNSLTEEDRENDLQIHQPLLEATSSSYLSINQKYPENDFLEWLVKDQFSKFSSQPLTSNKCFKRSLFTIEAFSGGASSVIFFVLGYNFIERFLKSTTVPRTGQIILSSLYGMTDYIPMVFLGTELTSNVINKLFHKKSQEEKSIERKTTCKDHILEYGLKTPVMIAAILSASPLVYLTYDDLFHYIKWAWLVPGIPTFYVRTFIDYYSITTLSWNIYSSLKAPIDKRFARSNPHSRRAYSLRIRNVLQKAHSYISSLNYSQAEELTQILKEDLDPLEKFKILFHPEDFITEPVNIKKGSLLRSIIGIAGGIVGSCGQMIVYPVEQDSFAHLLTLVGLENKKPLINTLAIIGTVTASSLSALATWNSTLKFYDAVSGIFSSIFNCFKPQSEKIINTEKENRFFWKRLGVGIVSGILAVCSVGPSAEVTLKFLNINEIFPKLELACAVIAVFSTTFWVMDEVLLKLLKAEDPRQQLLNIIDEIILKIPDLSKKELRRLVHMFQEGVNI